jgi:hypothetical protein
MNNENLIPAKKGEVRNPKGYPKGKPNLKTLIEKVWNEEITDAKGDKKIQGLLAVKAILDKAQQGDVSAFRELANRLEGLPTQKTELTGKDGENLLPPVIKFIGVKPDES